jgi:hypothetical protein
MMYESKLAVAIKSNGKVLREFNKDTVYLPFGSEYSIFIKNLNSVRALVKIEIDGQDVTGHGGLVIYGNAEIDLERFIQNGNFEQGNRFKFIERTESIERHRGVGVEDGLIRVEFQFEKPQPVYDWGQIKTWYKPQYPYVPNDPWGSPQVYYGTCQSPTIGSPLRGMSVGGGTSTSCSITTSSAYDPQSAQADYTFACNAVNDAGITVPGSISDQKFVTASWFPTEVTKHVMVFKLLGETEKGNTIAKPVTVKAKPKCTTCGRVNKATAKFCVECGTSLQIVA